MSVSVCKNWEPSKILHAIVNTNFDNEGHRINAAYKSYTYIICGRPGPTGKTWLYNRLFERDYKVVELSEDMIGLVEYNDNENHVVINGFNRSVLIILNKPLNRD